MARGNGVKVDARRLLVERVASSRYVNRSARLRDLLLYLTDRVLEDETGEIHEQEVGCRVFGRRPNYDTNSDNIVRVHASMLRKRLEQYFSAEGAVESMILEIPKGNYAPVFRERGEVEMEPAAPPAGLPAATPLGVEPERQRDWRLWALASAALLFASSTALLLVRQSLSAKDALGVTGPTVRDFWSQVFQSGRPTDVVLDDASMGLYQELTRHPLSLSDYFDRSYLRGLAGTAAAARLDPEAASSLVLRRQTSVSGATFSGQVTGHRKPRRPAGAPAVRP